MPSYAVESRVISLAGSPSEDEFPLAKIQEIITATNQKVDDELPTTYEPTDIGYTDVVDLANLLAAIEVRKEWYDIGKKIPSMEKDANDLREKLRKGYPESSKNTGLIYTELPQIDDIYWSPRFLGGDLYGYPFGYGPTYSEY